MTHDKSCNAPRHDFYMHVVPFVTKVVTSWCNKNLIVNGYNQRLYGNKYPVNDNINITSDTTYDAWTYDSINHAYVHINSTAIINGYSQRLCTYIHTFITNHIKISMYESTTNNQHLTCSLININNIDNMITIKSSFA